VYNDGLELQLALLLQYALIVEHDTAKLLCGWLDVKQQLIRNKLVSIAKLKQRHVVSVLTWFRLLYCVCLVIDDDGAGGSGVPHAADVRLSAAVSCLNCCSWRVTPSSSLYSTEERLSTVWQCTSGVLVTYKHNLAWISSMMLLVWLNT
jgi:hypothetical protein